MTTLYDFGGVLGRNLDALIHLGSQNVMVTALNSHVALKSLELGFFSRVHGPIMCLDFVGCLANYGE